VLIGDPAFICILDKWENTGTRQSGKLMLTWPLQMVPDVYLGSAFICAFHKTPCRLIETQHLLETLSLLDVLRYQHLADGFFYY